MTALMNLLHAHKLLVCCCTAMLDRHCYIEPVLLACSLDNVKTAQCLPLNEEWQDNLLMVIRTYSVK